MKKMSKRFFTLVMALVMALSCTAVASAVEVETSEPYPISISDENGTYATNSAREMVALTDIVRVDNITSGKTVSGSFNRSIPSTSNVTIVINTPMSCTVDVKNNWGVVGATKTLLPGTQTVTLGSGYGKLKYSIRFHDASTSAAAFQFFTTDAAYPQ